MESGKIKNESPACSCGRGDLYMESMKLKENENDAASEKTVENSATENSNVAKTSG